MLVHTSILFLAYGWTLCWSIAESLHVASKGLAEKDLPWLKNITRSIFLEIGTLVTTINCIEPVRILATLIKKTQYQID